MVLWTYLQRRHGRELGIPNGRWELQRGAVAHLANHVNVGVRVKWFRLMLQHFLKESQVRYVTSTVRPFSQWVCCFRGCLGFSLDDDEYHRIETFLGSSLGSPATGTGKSLNSVRI